MPPKILLHHRLHWICLLTHLPLPARDSININPWLRKPSHLKTIQSYTLINAIETY